MCGQLFNIGSTRVTWGFLWALQARGKTKYAKHIPPARFYCIGGFDFAFAFRPHPAGVDCAAGLRWMMLTLQVQLIVWFHLMSHLPLLLASSCSPWVRQFPPHQWHQCVVIVPSLKGLISRLCNYLPRLVMRAATEHSDSASWLQ